MSCRSGWTVRVLSLFPEAVRGGVLYGLAGKAHDSGIWRLETVDIRDYALGNHRKVDDDEFGGGGMVLRADVLDAALSATSNDLDAVGRSRTIYLSPRGRRVDQRIIEELAQESTVTLLCGRYEGVDERIIEAHRLEELSLGDFILSGGELAAAAIIDATVRLLPGVVGNPGSVVDESFTGGLLEYPHYTRPAVWRDRWGVERAVPEVLRSGHHREVDRWRRASRLAVTRDRRPDLWRSYQDAQQDPPKDCP